MTISVRFNRKIKTGAWNDNDSVTEINNNKKEGKCSHTDNSCSKHKKYNYQFIFKLSLKLEVR